MPSRAKQTDLIRRKLVRLATGTGDTQPVHWDDGKAAPSLTGSGYYWTTPGGKPIHSPSAYRWPKVYHASTIEIHAGRDWVASITPSGMEWRCDDNGPYLCRLSDGMDWHPARSDLARTDFRGHARRQMAANYRLRITARREAAIQAKLLPCISVSLHDSRRAGNCVHGTLAWAQRKLGISPDDALSAGHLLSVDAQRCLLLANGDRTRVEAAIKCAIQRLTLVSI